MFTSIVIPIVAAAVFGLLASIVFSWASNRSAAWNLAFVAAIVLVTAAGLLVSVVIAMRCIRHHPRERDSTHGIDEAPSEPILPLSSVR